MTAKSTNGSGDSSQTASGSLKPPLVLWAQRADKLLLTIDIEDCKSPIIKLEKDKLYFRGKSDSMQQDADHKEHEVTIEFYKPIKTEDSLENVRARGIEFVIFKEQAEWWPRLLKDSTKQHWLKVDFPKWKDEDESEDEAGGMPGMGGMGGFGGGAGGQPDFSDLMQHFGNMGGAGGPPGDFDGEDGDEESDDEDDTEQALPDLQ